MRRTIWGLLIGLIVGCGIQVTYIHAQGPFTAAPNLRVRTDANGYLLVSSAAYTASDGPLTNFGNIRLRTDSSGYLLVVMPTSSVNAIGTTSTNAFTVQNTTASTVGTPVQMSPYIRWCGTAYNSTSTLSETDCMFAEVLPATVAGTTTQTWKLGSIINGGAATYPLTVSSGSDLTILGVMTANDILLSSGRFLRWINKSSLSSATDGLVAIGNFGQTVGSMVKVDALPTVASGFGTSPAITAGSTPLAGSINVGTGAPGTGGVINFNGTAFPSSPFVVCMDDSSLLIVRCTATTTQLTIAATALTASDIVSWLAISSK